MSVTPSAAAPEHPTDPAEARSGLIEPEQVVILVTGMSGAGRSTTADVLEDHGWYVVDNLPARMLPELVREVGSEGRGTRVAAVADARTRGESTQVRASIEALRAAGWNPRTVFLDASDETLVRRFESVRRPHPGQGGGLLLDAIRAERSALAEVRAEAHVVIDTSGLNVHRLRVRVEEILGAASGPQMRIALMSFGFKYGIPLDADIVLDMRFLPNPFWVPSLRGLTGQDAPVRDFVLAQDGVEDFLRLTEELLHTVSRGFLRERRRYLTVGIGCTGGKHRSVTAVEALAARWEDPDVTVRPLHRDLGRE